MNQLTRSLLLCAAPLLLASQNAISQSKPSYSVGSAQLCSLDEEGQAECTISNGFERLQVPASLPALTAITAGDTHACGITLEGDAVCWGDNVYGQLNMPSISTALVKINAGANHTCALDIEGAAICWGLNSNNQLDAPEGARFVEIDAVTNSSCGILDNGNITCWTNDGLSAHDELPGPFIDLDTRRRHVCGLTTAGEIQCFSNTNIIPTPPEGDGFIDLAVTIDTVCGLRSDGTLECNFNDEEAASDYPIGEQFLSIQSDETDTGFIINFANGNSRVFGTTMCGERFDGTVDCWVEGGNFPDLENENPTSLQLLETFEFDLDAKIYDSNAVELFWTPIPHLTSGFLAIEQPRVEIYRNNELIDTVLARFSYFDRNAVEDANYQIRLIDNSGNTGELSGVLSVNTSARTVLFNGEPTVQTPQIDLMPEVFTDLNRVGLVNGFILWWAVEPELEDSIDGYLVELNGNPTAFTRSKLFVSLNSRGSSCIEVAAIDFDGSVVGRRNIGTCN